MIESTSEIKAFRYKSISSCPPAAQVVLPGSGKVAQDPVAHTVESKINWGTVKFFFVTQAIVECDICMRSPAKFTVSSQILMPFTINIHYRGMCDRLDRLISGSYESPVEDLPKKLSGKC